MADPASLGENGDCPAATGDAAIAPDPFPILPANFGRYRVIRLLGRGGMGAVYLADDSQLDRQVALKIPFFSAADSARRARFTREAQAAAALHHPNICTVFDAGEIDGRPYLTMAYVAGTPLDRVIDPDAPLPQARAAAVARSIALALDCAHGRGVVHRDLKPANVMIGPDGEPVVTDFGLAKRFGTADAAAAGGTADGTHRTRDGGVLGTPSYMAPEQVRGDVAVGPAADIYALGAVLFEMLTGRPPYVGGVREVFGRILAAPIPPLTEFRPDADPRLETVCRWALAKDPAERFPSMTAFAAALDDFLADAAATADPFRDLAPEKPEPTAPPPRRPLLPRVLVAVLAILAAAAAVAVAIRPRGGSSAVEPAAVPKPPATPTVRPQAPPSTIPAPTPPAKADPELPAASVAVAEKSEWAGLGTANSAAGGRRIGGAWTFTERRGNGFKALWRDGFGSKVVYEGTFNEAGGLELEFRTVLEPQAGPRLPVRGRGDVTPTAISLAGELSDDSATCQLALKLLPTAGADFNFRGRWKCVHRPNRWYGFRTVTGAKNFIDYNGRPGTWERDGGLIIVHFVSGGREWLVLDPDNRDELAGSNSLQNVTWYRQ